MFWSTAAYPRLSRAVSWRNCRTSQLASPASKFRMERALPGVDGCARFSLAYHKGGLGRGVGQVPCQWRDNPDGSGLVTYTLVEQVLRTVRLYRVSHTDGRAAPKCPAFG